MRFLTLRGPSELSDFRYLLGAYGRLRLVGRLDPKHAPLGLHATGVRGFKVSGLGV